MTDRLSYLKLLQHPQESITPSQFSSWKQLSVTRAMFKDLVIAVFNQLDEPIPASFEQTVILTHQREGAMTVIDQLINWEPETVTEAKNKAAETGKPVEDAE